jgi:hypothetical protein
MSSSAFSLLGIELLAVATAAAADAFSSSRKAGCKMKIAGILHFFETYW